MADGEILIDTKINNSGLNADLEKTGKKIDTLTTKFSRQTTIIKERENALEKLKRQLDAITESEKAPASLISMEAQQKRNTKEIETQQKAYDEVVAKIQEVRQELEFSAEVGQTEKVEALLGEFTRLEEESLVIADKLGEAEDVADKLAKSIAAVKIDPSTSAEAEDLSNKIALAEERLSNAKNEAGATKRQLQELFEIPTEPIEVGIHRVNESIKQVGATAKKTSDNTQQIAKSTGEISNIAQEARRSFVRLGKQIKTLVLSAFVFLVIRRALRQMAADLGRVLNANNDFSKSLNDIKVNLLTAFAPIWEAITPAIVAFMKILAQATSLLAQFVALLFGKTVSQSRDSAKALNEQSKALDGVGSAAKKAGANLMRFDELNNRTSSDDSGGGGGAGESGLNFEDIEDANPSWLDPFIAKMGELARLFESGFWEGFASADLSKMFDTISGIKQSLTEIFTDPAVLGAMDSFVSAYVFNLGRVVGSVASIGVSIATGLLGGFNKFLEANKDSIKETLISVFNIGEEITYIVGDFWVSLAEIFTVFADENAQNMVASFLGIFYEISRTIVELGARIGRDFIRFLTEPITENEEKIKVALDDLMGYFANVGETLEGLFEHIGDELIKLYDNHIKPFVDIVIKSFTEWFEKILDGWTKYVQPVLDDFAKKFREVVEQHVQPMIDKAMVFFGKLFDYLAKVWDEILRPLVSWMIDNFMKDFGFVLGFVGDAFSVFLAVVSDIIDLVLDIFISFIDFLMGIFSSDWIRTWTKLGDTIRDWWYNHIAPWFSVSKWIELGKAAIEGLLGGLASIGNKIAEWGGGIINSVKNVFGIHSPSVVFREFGEFLMKGLMGGIDDEEGAPIQSVQDVMDYLTRLLEEQDNTFGNFGEMFIKSLSNGIRDNESFLIRTLRNTLNKMTDCLEFFAGNAISELNRILSSYASSLSSLTGSSVSFTPVSMPSIPRLAQGGIVDKATIAMIGERGREAVMPLENNTGWITDLANQIGAVIGANSGGGTVTGNQPMQVALNIDSRQFAQAIVDPLQAETNRRGINLSPRMT